MAQQLQIQCRSKSCSETGGVDFGSDLSIYNLQDAIIFSESLSVVVTCPSGRVCPPGTNYTYEYPPGTWQIPIPTPRGQSIVMQLQGCQSAVSRVLPATASDAEIEAAANEIMAEVAQQQAECDLLASLPPQVAPVSLTSTDLVLCANVLADFTITGSPAPAAGLDFAIISGSVPAGMSFEDLTLNTCRVTGTPTTLGSYTFTVAAYAPGYYGTASFTITVAGIVNASPLPDATVGVDYSEQLTSSGISLPPSGVLTWGVVGGLTNLPPWMQLNTTTGLLFSNVGDPPTAGSWNFTVTVSNGTNTCQKEFDISTASASACAIFESLVWGAPSYNITDGDADISASGNTVSGSSSTPASFNANSGEIVGTVSFTGSETGCCIDADFSNTTCGAFSLDITQDGNPIASCSSDDLFPFNFTIAAGVASELVVTVNIQSGACDGEASSITVTSITIGGCP